MSLGPKEEAEAGLRDHGRKEYSRRRRRRASEPSLKITAFLAWRLRSRSLLCGAAYLYLLAFALLSVSCWWHLFSEKATTAAAENSENMAAAKATPRLVKAFVPGQKMMEGGGVPVYRTIGTSAMRNLDPFLMLDEFKSPSKDASMGFPDHPHRGFETCTIMLKGSVEHRDHGGNKGLVGPGGIQFMSAGRGIVHSEFPKSKGDDMLWGFQLWINLPRKDKMCTPRYQDYEADKIPIFSGESHSVRVFSGEHSGVKGPVALKIPGFLLDVRLEAGGSFSHDFPEHWNSFAYVYDAEGNGTLAGAPPRVRESHIFDHKGSLLEASTEGTLKFLLFGAEPIKEPIVQYGPFVMNTEEEIQQAFMDFRTGKLQASEVEMMK